MKPTPFKKILLFFVLSVILEGGPSVCPLSFHSNPKGIEDWSKGEGEGCFSCLEAVQHKVSQL